MQWRGVVWGTCVLMLAACGGDANSGRTLGGERSSSGVSGSGSVDKLSTQDTSKLCSWVIDKAGALYDDNPERVCTFFITSLGETGDACTKSVKSCVDDAQSEPGEDTSADDAKSCASDLGACPASVNEFETCFNDQFARIGELFERASCTTPLTQAELQSYDMLPPSCQALQTKCPKLFAEDDSADDEQWFTCNPGEPVETDVGQADVCDGVADCENGADELNCEGVTQSGP